jgi:hypothetical protein
VSLGRSADPLAEEEAGDVTVPNVVAELGRLEARQGEEELAGGVARLDVCRAVEQAEQCAE